MHSTALRYFLEVARSGSIAEASEQLNVASSAISRQISKLEDMLKVTLFERRPRGMVLSPAGEKLAEHAQRIILETDKAFADVQQMTGPERGLVRIACYEGFGNNLMPQIVAEFRRRYPDVRFSAWIGNSPDICQRIQQGESDIGVTYTFAPPNSVSVQTVVSRPIHALLPLNHALADRPFLILDELVKYPIALPSKDRTQRQLIDTALSSRGLFIDPVYSTNSMANLVRFGQEEDCITFSSSIGSTIPKVIANQIAIPMKDDVLAASALQILTMQGRELPPVISNFMDFMIERL